MRATTGDHGGRPAASADELRRLMDELRAAQDALETGLLVGVASSPEEAVAELLRAARTTADAIVTRAEQEAATIRRLARLELERFTAELAMLRRQAEVARDAAIGSTATGVGEAGTAAGQDPGSDGGRTATGGNAGEDRAPVGLG